MTQSNKLTTEVMNEAIAVFNGWIKYEDDQYGAPYFRNNKGRFMNYVHSLEYHTSWDCLMPVVEKIEAIHDEFHGYFAVHISSNGCTIQGTKFRTDPGNEHYAYFNDVTHESKIMATHYMVYKFIQWYNQQKQKDGNPVT